MATISYDDILSSLNMKVVDGKLVIVRNLEKEKQKKNEKRVQPEQQPQQQQQQQQQQQHQQQLKTPLEQLQEHLKRKQQKKMFMQTVNNPTTALKMDFNHRFQ